MEFTKNFSELSKKDANIAGGKGASLGEMTKAGIPVPGGYVVLSSTFDHFLKETDLAQEIDAILKTVDHKAIHTVDAASEKIRGLVESREVPEDIATEIRAEFKKLGAEFVAVRSSATAEDGAEHAWAGQLDSFLNTNEDTLLDNVRRCWGSLFTPRAIFYRFEKELHGTEISVAVVVQKMIQSEVSGIAFSVHPITEDYNQLIIEGGYGLGEAIVSGSITPDSYVVEKSPRRIIDTNISEQKRGLFKNGASNEWKEISATEGALQKLSNEQVLELSEVIVGIENHYGFPCDIEWAYEGGKFYIVQSRPITTLQPRTEVSSEVTFVSPELKDFDTAGYDFDGLWKNDLFATCFWQDCWVPDVARDMGLGLKGVGVMNLKGGHFLVEKSVREEMNKQIGDLIEKRNSEFFKNLVTVSDEIFSWGVKKGEEISSKEATPENFKDFVETAKRINFLWLIGATYTNWPVEKALQDAVVEDNFPAEHVMDIIPKIDTPLHQYQAGLVQLKKLIGLKSFAEVQEDKELYEQLRKHAETYSWVEIFNFIGESMTVEKLYDSVMHLEKGAEGHRVYVPEKPVSERLKFALQCMHDVGYVKQGGAEYFSIFSEKVIPFLQKVSEKIGITYREMMCLSTYEIQDGLEGKKSSEDLKKFAANRIGVNDWAIIGDKNGNSIFIEDLEDVKLLVEKMIPKTDTNAKELKGQIGNKGKYVGPVRIVMNTYDFDKVVPGDVLVTTMTTPDFIVLMQKSGAIVTDIGGLLCHAAIVSRELGKACVIGTKFATQLLKDDMQVEVDADKGIVRILD